MAQWLCPVSTHGTAPLYLWHALGAVLCRQTYAGARPAQLMGVGLPVC